MLKVSGMKLVRVLHGRVHNSRFEEVYTPSFPSNYKLFFHYYHLNNDLGYKIWSKVVLPVQGLISCLLCRSFLGQGDNFFRWRSKVLQFTNYQWSWLSSFSSSHGSPPCNVALSHHSKHLLVCPTVVYANSIQSACSRIQCETAAQLKAVNFLFVNCCLVGLQDPPPPVNNSTVCCYKLAPVMFSFPTTPLSILLFEYF